MALNYNIRRIKSRASYSPSEVAKLLGVDRKTCFRWIKEGLEVIEKNTKPLLIMGEKLKIFIANKQAKRRPKLAQDEYFCMKCHKPVRAWAGSEQTIKTGKKIGKGDWEQTNKIGNCEHCGTKLNKFTRVCQGD
jgi:DNA-directed RNA polymerase subunit RPC12/RpoP